MIDYDVIVIGAGPAGTAAAISLVAEGRRVLLLEKSRFPREKLCGEFLTPECLPLFDQLGVRQRMLDAGAAIIRTFSLHSQEGARLAIPMSWIANRAPYAIGLSRSRMDKILIDRCRELGVEVREEFTVSPKLTFEGEAAIITGHGPRREATESFTTHLVIDASGRNGTFHRETGQTASHFRGARLFGCKVHLRRITQPDETGELFFFADGYGGLSAIEEDRTNLCFLTTERTLIEARGDREKLLDLTLRTNPAARERLRHAVTAGEWIGTGPISYGKQQSLPGILHVGDAGAFIDPFTGSGMLLALSSGILAGRTVNQHFAQTRPERESIISDYDHRHRQFFSLRYRAVSTLRQLAFHPVARPAAVAFLTRCQPLARFVARATRAS